MKKTISTLLIATLVSPVLAMESPEIERPFSIIATNALPPIAPQQQLTVATKPNTVTWNGVKCLVKAKYHNDKIAIEPLSLKGRKSFNRQVVDRKDLIIHPFEKDELVLIKGDLFRVESYDNDNNYLTLVDDEDGLVLHNDAFDPDLQRIQNQD